MRPPGAAHNRHSKTSQHLNYADKTPVCFCNYIATAECWFKPGVRRPIKCGICEKTCARLTSCLLFPASTAKGTCFWPRSSVCAAVCQRWTTLRVVEPLTTPALRGQPASGNLRKSNASVYVISAGLCTHLPRNWFVYNFHQTSRK